MPKKSPSSPTPITSHTHTDKRANIPTEELRDVVADEDRRPKALLCPRCHPNLTGHSCGWGWM